MMDRKPEFLELLDRLDDDQLARLEVATDMLMRAQEGEDRLRGMSRNDGNRERCS